MSNDPLDRIDPACERYENRLAAGSRPGLEEALESVDAAHAGDRRLLFFHLLRLELEYRPPADWAAARRSLRRRFPDLRVIVDRVIDTRRARPGRPLPWTE